MSKRLQSSLTPSGSLPGISFTVRSAFLPPLFDSPRVGDAPPQEKGPELLNGQGFFAAAGSNAASPDHLEVFGELR